jgi:Txe/YoeB family toxin of Txe-Axe toxin-antitoxin module
MPFKGGEINLFVDGTVEAKHATADHVIELFSALEPPVNGSVWWKIFLANQAYQRTVADFDKLAALFHFSNNEKSVSRNNRIVEWIKNSGIFRSLSFVVFYEAKAHLWDAKAQEPRSDRDAKKILAFIKEHPFPTRKHIEPLLPKDQERRQRRLAS